MTSLPNGYRVRDGLERDLDAAAAIARDAALVPADGLPVPTAEPIALAALDLCRAAGTLWIAADAQDEPVGVLAATDADGAFHIACVAVAAPHRHRGLGRALIAAAVGHARFLHYPAVTLLADRAVPWGKPFYARHGFLELRASALSPELSRRLAAATTTAQLAERTCAMAKLL